MLSGHSNPREVLLSSSPKKVGRPPGSQATPCVSRKAALTYKIEEAARLLGIGRNQAYDAARNGSFPVPIIEIGRRKLVPRAPLDQLLATGKTF
jgi:excisionase family DNA binding protein